MTQMPIARGHPHHTQAFCKKKWIWERALTLIKFGSFYPKLNDLYFLYFMIIYQCIKYESNTLMFSRDIKWKLFFNTEKGP